MSDNDETLTVTIKPELEGLGDAETHTLDIAVAESIGDLIKQNLRNRYEHLTRETEIDVLALSAPNRVAIHYSQPDADD